MTTSSDRSDAHPQAQQGSSNVDPSAGQRTQAQPTVPLQQHTQPTVPLPQHTQPTEPLSPQTPQSHDYGYSQQQGPAQSHYMPQHPQASQQQPQPPQHQAQVPAHYGYEQQAASIPAAGGNGGGASGDGHQEYIAAPAPQEGKQKSRAGILVAGLAAGALIGGIVGGGVAAIVGVNSNSSSVASGTNGKVTIANPENATAISAVAAVATPSVVTLEVSSSSSAGSGSGVIIRDDGYIVTNAHVVTLDGATQDASIKVKTSDGSIYTGKTVGIDPYADLAVVKIDATDLKAIEFADSGDVSVGDLTVAIGAPLDLSNTVTSGVVSTLNRGISVGSPLIPADPSEEDGGNGNGDSGQGDGGDDDNGFGFPWDFEFESPDGGDSGQGDNGSQQQEQTQQSSGSVTLPVIQTDASINPGNSGGALLNGEGKLIGVNVAIASAVTGTDGTAGSNGLGFSIPVNLVKRVTDSIIDGDQPSHGLLGAAVADSSQDTDEDANHSGGLITSVNKGGAAEKAGLKAGDVITAVDGVQAVDGTSVSALIRYHEGGSKVAIEYTRNGKAGKTEATLGKLSW